MSSTRGAQSLRFASSRLKEVNAPTSVARDQFAIIDECIGTIRAIATERDERSSAVQATPSAFCPNKFGRSLALENQASGGIGDHENCLRMSGENLHGLEPHVVWCMYESKDSAKRASVRDAHESLAV